MTIRWKSVEFNTESNINIPCNWFTRLLSLVYELDMDPKRKSTSLYTHFLHPHISTNSAIKKVARREIFSQLSD